MSSRLHSMDNKLCFAYRKVSFLQVLNGNVIDGSAAFDAIAQEQIKKTSTVTSANNNLQINVSDGKFS